MQVHKTIPPRPIDPIIKQLEPQMLSHKFQIGTVNTEVAVKCHQTPSAVIGPTPSKKKANIKVMISPKTIIAGYFHRQRHPLSTHQQQRPTKTNYSEYHLPKALKKVNDAGIDDYFQNGGMIAQ